MSENTHYWFNVAEAGVWLIIGLGFAVRAIRVSAHRTLAWVTAGAFVGFGVSDLIELETGAWYRPWSLFVFKAVCVLAFVTCYVLFRRSLTRSGTPQPEGEHGG